jgi:Rrf2 family iron-sulfur cluster assembly transcriptional regulator
MKLSSKARYAIMAMMEVAIRNNSRPVTLADISEEHGLSISYLEQLFARLRNNKLVAGTRGPGGGYRLAKPAEQISIADIANAVEDKIRVKKPLTQTEFNVNSFKVINGMWDNLSDRLNDYLGHCMLSEFVNPHITDPTDSSSHLKLVKDKDKQVA